MQAQDTPLDLKPYGEFSVEVREATRADIRRCENPGHASVGEAAAVLVDGEVVAVTNEYGTALLVPGTETTPTREQVESFLQCALDFHEAGRFPR